LEIAWRARLKSFGQLLILTRKEKQVVVFVLAAFLLGVVVKHYRETHPIVTVPAKPQAKSKTPRQTTRRGRNVSTPPATRDKADD
jgi:hypothetical protein